ncbi:hypothetical protein T12_8569 [Trichinella patagoniensis]|uniref:Uncharacterized protein n=1 Tax=Trichinella patagoniensis TaxID=990121 RepID=A0A0V0ZIS4_9BILA|nr:hypothetical protein T12_8569 [Trichinella patagoniensis]
MVHQQFEQRCLLRWEVWGCLGVLGQALGGRLLPLLSGRRPLWPSLPEVLQFLLLYVRVEQWPVGGRFQLLSVGGQPPWSILPEQGGLLGHPSRRGVARQPPRALGQMRNISRTYEADI